MQLNFISVLVAALAISTSAVSAKKCKYVCPPTANSGADTLASQSSSDGTLTCFYYFGSGPITNPPGGGGPGPVLHSCDYDATSGALTRSVGYAAGACPSVASCK